MALQRKNKKVPTAAAEQLARNVHRAQTTAARPLSLQTVWANHFWQLFRYIPGALTNMGHIAIKPTSLLFRCLRGFLLTAACVRLIHDASSVTLAWDPNSEPDIAGYILH